MSVYQPGIVTMTIAVNAMDCPACGIVFGVTEDLENHRRKDGKNFYCPNGHSISYEGEINRLRAQNTRLQDESNRAWAEVGRLREDVKGRERRIKQMERRANAGVCPHCQRTFQQVQRHISKKHPQQALEKHDGEERGQSSKGTAR